MPNFNNNLNIAIVFGDTNLFKNKCDLIVDNINNGPPVNDLQKGFQKRFLESIK
tara:strand:+ start:1269 stop:1430 length:162 start_codon:yes stop_codon:yes gene_type:complete